MAIKLIYSDIALGAAEDAEVTASESERFSVPGALPFGVSTGAVATCELNAWGLSQDYKTRGSQPIAIWSKDISDSEGVFSNAPSVIIDFTEQYSSTGLSFRFSPDANEYCTKITVGWFQNDELKERGTFYPDSPSYALERTVEAFDRIICVFENTNLPQRRLKLEQLAIGIIREIDGRELTSAKVVQEIDFISNTVPINVLDASFHSKTDTEYLFQRKQPVEAYNGKDLIGVFYIESGERLSERNYSISCQDAIGVLELDTYKGGLWLTDTPIEAVLYDIVGDAFEIEIDEALAGATVRGYIEPDKTKREALQNVAFSLGACIDTSGTAKIRLFLTDTGEGVVIPPQETYKGGKVSTADTVTEVIITSYEITDETPGDNDEVIEFEGKEYKCEASEVIATNPNTTVSTLANKVSFDGCYLCNTSNAERLANSILAYYMRRNTYSTKHIVSGQNLGDRATVHLPWGDVKNANVKKMTVSVTGLTVSDTEFLLD
jgi:hypothetical protein